MRKVEYSCGEFMIESEYNKEGFIFMHCTVNKWNKTVYKSLQAEWNKIKVNLKSHKHLFVATKEKKTEKFIRLLGFTLLKPNIENTNLFWIEV